MQKQSILSKNLTVKYKNVVYQIQISRPSYAMGKAPVTVCEDAQGMVKILYNDQPLG